MNKHKPLAALAVVALRRWTFTMVVLLSACGDVATETSYWAVANEQSALHVDHSAWNLFLQNFVVNDADGVNRLRYAEVDADARQALAAYVSHLAGYDPRELSRLEQFAYWLNLYNALTVDVVLRHPGVASILDMGSGTNGGPWRDPVIEITGRPLTLDDIEHGILRPIFKDHRIHYGVNCASFSCPNLLDTAYTAENVSALLDDAEAAYINHSRAVFFDDDGALHLSSIYKWYADDFAADEQGLLLYLSEHHVASGERLAEYRQRIHYRYDWTLNAAD